MISAKKNREIVNDTIKDNVRAFAEGDLQKKINEAVEECSFEVRVPVPANVDLDVLVAYVAEYGYTATKNGYDIIVKW